MGLSFPAVSEPRLLATRSFCKGLPRDSVRAEDRTEARAEAFERSSRRRCVSVILTSGD